MWPLFLNLRPGGPSAKREPTAEAVGRLAAQDASAGGATLVHVVGIAHRHGGGSE